MLTFLVLFAYAIATWLGASPLPWWLTIALLLAAIATDLIGLGRSITSPSLGYSRRRPVATVEPAQDEPGNIVTFIVPKDNRPPHG